MVARKSLLSPFRTSVVSARDRQVFDMYAALLHDSVLAISSPVSDVAGGAEADIAMTSAAENGKAAEAADTEAKWLGEGWSPLTYPDGRAYAVRVLPRHCLNFAHA